MKLSDCYDRETLSVARTLIRKRFSLRDVRSALIAQRDASAAALQAAAPAASTDPMILPFHAKAAVAAQQESLLSNLHVSTTHLRFVDTLSQEYPRSLTLKGLQIPQWNNRYRVLLELDAPEGADLLEWHKDQLVRAAVVTPYMRDLPMTPALTIAMHASEQLRIDLLEAMERHIASAILDILDPDGEPAAQHGAPR